MSISGSSMGLTRTSSEFWSDRNFRVCVISIVFLLLIFGGLKIYSISLNAQLSDIQDEMGKIDEGRNFEEETEIQRKIVLFEKLNSLLGSHVRAAKVFTLLENNTYTDIQLSGLSFDLGNNTLTMSIASPFASALSVQISLFRNDSNVQKVEIGGFSYGEGELKFQLKLTFNPEMVEY